MGLPASAFPMDLPSPGLMLIPDVSQPQPLTGASGKGLHSPLSVPHPSSIIHKRCSIPGTKPQHSQESVINATRALTRMAATICGGWHGKQADWPL